METKFKFKMKGKSEFYKKKRIDFGENGKIKSINRGRKLN